MTIFMHSVAPVREEPEAVVTLETNGLTCIGPESRQPVGRN
jgi:hypothetical protein